MKKSLVLASLLVIGSTSAMAAKVGDTIIGVEFGGQHVSSTTTATNLTTGVSASASGSDNTTYEAIKVGKYIKYGRVGVTLGHGNSKNGVKSNYLGASYDYVFYNDSKFSPFIGAIVAYSKTTATGSGFTVNENGFSYGGEAGLTYDISSKFDLEIGARYLSSNASGDDTQTISGTPVKVTVNVDNITQYYFGVNYKF